MIKLFVTGDNHLCRQYINSPVKDILVQSRLDSLTKMVHMAESEECDYFIITGDLFDRVNNISKKEVDQVVSILEEFNQTVLVLPGNHDFYTGSEKLWKDFLKRTAEIGNIMLLNKYEVYKFGTDENELVIYPAYCDSKHSKSNRLSWISKSIEKDVAFCIGIAHGTIRGVAPDLKEEFFPMDVTELNAIPVDAWLIGHTHITYPLDLPYDKDIRGYSIFNAGTHEQLDSGNNTEGNAFVILLDRVSGIKRVTARKLHTGNITYKNIRYTIEFGETRSFKQILIDLSSGLSERSIVSLEIDGSINEEEYTHRQEYYESVFGKFIDYHVEDEMLAPEISMDKIHNEYSEFSLAAQLLEELMSDPVEVQMAYDLLKKCSGAV